MPAPSKIQDRGEVLRWFEEGRTYPWMVDTYKTKYGIKTTPTMWANFRRREGLTPRVTRDTDLIPWKVKQAHRWRYPVVMLRLEARLRAGRDISEEETLRLASWKKMLTEESAVVHYDPKTEEGFHYVRRQPGDKDLIHNPEASLGISKRSTKEAERDQQVRMRLMQRMLEAEGAVVEADPETGELRVRVPKADDAHKIR